MIEIACAADVRSRLSPDLDWLQRSLVAALRHAGAATPIAYVGVSVIGDERMRQLHRDYRQRDETTDVLCFGLSEPGRPVEVDLVLCADEAARQGARRGHSLEREMLLYALHGVLHGAGYDDATDEGFQTMHAEEDRILAALGIGATFARAAEDDGERAS